ncbi:uncharacterized protein TrAFT101_009495 [Trichoderma asperellum]|uniref:uncharacterized protein n=1 Tax=Trichoderma asperellum TaxID=101201 RepID=UPI00332B83BC|nr:hypothetical protein TrAFT101_009495 [Trichoderma asperellum]
MSCVGAPLSDDEQDAELSWMLRDMLADGHLVGMVLQMVAITETYRVLVGSVRGMGLLSSSFWGIIDDSQDRIESAGAENDLEFLNRQWLSWVNEEHECRSAWAAFDVEFAEMRLKSAFAKEAYKGRRLLWHAAKVVGIADEYLVSAPSEIIRVFMAYTFIMAYSTYGSRITSTTGDKLPLRLDLPCHEDTARR